MMARMMMGMAAVFAAGTVQAEVLNYFPNPGFESWDAKSGMPTAEKHRWSLASTGKDGFTVLERSVAERHSGEASLHLKDANGGPHNHALRCRLGKDCAHAVRGKVLYLSGWVKVVSSSSDAGLALTLSAVGGKANRSVGISPTLCGSNGWVSVRTKLRVPEDAKDITVSFDCAYGYHRTAEAYFDDIVVSLDPADHPRTTYVPAAKRALHQLEYRPTVEDSPEEAAYRAGYREQPPQEEDGRTRPEIVSGNFTVNGEPQHYLGVWIYNRTKLDWPGNKLKIDHLAYKEPPSKKVFDAMGFNSAQISAAHDQIGATVRGFPLLKPSKWWDKYDWRADEEAIASYFHGFGDLPMVLDFAFGYHKRYPKGLHRQLEQRMDSWHAFNPFCPECPEGDRYYRDYFLGGTRAALRHGCNVFVYELFNESSYGCACRYNYEAFALEMRRRYGTIAAANERWGTMFDDWRELLCQSDYAQYPGVWYDWCRFLGKRYVETLKRYRDVVRQADRRRNVYFTEQEGGHPVTRPTMDYRLIAETLDVLALEGGWQYGFQTKYTASDEMEAVVAAGGSKHFYNCDWYQALAKGRRPVMNDEHYCTRFENGERAPSKKTDYITSLWLEVMHGVSANYTYVWDKRSFDYKDLAGAHENVRKPSYKSSSLLNPWNVKPEDLSAFKEFRDEFEPFRAQVMPFPRVKRATVGVVFSKASEIQKASLPRIKPPQKVPVWVNPRDTLMTDWYTTVLHAQYPVKVVFAADLATETAGLSALVFPNADSFEEESLPAVRAFAQRGGLVLAPPAAFRFDEFMKRRKAELAFVTRVADADGAVAELAKAKVPRYAALEPLDDPARPVSRADVQVCDRGDFKLVCLAALGETAPRPVRLRLMGLEGRGPWKLEDVVAKRTLAAPAGGSWTPAALEKGVELTLPPQERLILTLRSK